MSNKKFSLPIYGEDDAVIKEYGTDVIRFGILEDALKISEETEGQDATEQLKTIIPLIQRVFKGITEEEIKNADLFDVFNVFNQIIKLAAGLKNGNNSKN